MSKDLYVTWDEYFKKIEGLAKIIHSDGWDFNQVVCIAKGGMCVGDIISRIYDVPSVSYTHLTLPTSDLV